MEKLNPSIVFEDNLLNIYNCKMQKSSTGLDMCIAKEPCHWAHSSPNGKYCSDPSIPLMDISNCRVRVDNSGVAVCMAEKKSCRFCLANDDKKMCFHPLTTNQIANRLELDFGKIKWVREDIAEVIINGSVELTASDVGKLHGSMISRYKAPFSVLLNQVNSYSYSFCALTTFGTIPEMGRIAVVTYSSTNELAAKMFQLTPREIELNLKIFNNKAEALQWLI